MSQIMKKKTIGQTARKLNKELRI